VILTSENPKIEVFKKIGDVTKNKVEVDQDIIVVLNKPVSRINNAKRITL
jgi:hypothetical protein